ncbi:MAG: enoyl-CoA hydratase-related protein, partial [Actinomycetota bacterium]
THHRIVTGNAALGQPEVKLGIIPGYGGMQRLPRLVGPRRAAQLSVYGESISASEAVATGLASEYQPSGTALRRAFEVAKELADAGRPLAPDWSALAMANNDEFEQLLADPTVTELLGAEPPDRDTASDLVKARRYAARIALEALRDGWELDLAGGLANDARLFGHVVASPSGQYWAGRFLAKDPAQQTFLTQLG